MIETIVISLTRSSLVGGHTQYGKWEAITDHTAEVAAMWTLDTSDKNVAGSRNVKLQKLHMLGLKNCPIYKESAV